MSLKTIAILLAAGQSRRMGTQKLLLPYAGQPVVRHIVGQIQQSAVADIIVVVGQDRARIAKAIANTRTTLIPNDDPEADMLSSVRCGLRACPPDCDAVLVALGDQPSITSSLIKQIISAFDPPRRNIIVPTHTGQRGHPILFASQYREEIFSRFDGIGLRGLLLAHAGEVVELEVATPSVLADMDVPEDYRRELKRLIN